MCLEFLWYWSTVVSSPRIYLYCESKNFKAWQIKVWNKKNSNNLSLSRLKRVILNCELGSKHLMKEQKLPIVMLLKVQCKKKSYSWMGKNTMVKLWSVQLSDTCSSCIVRTKATRCRKKNNSKNKRRKLAIFFAHGSYVQLFFPSFVLFCREVKDTGKEQLLSIGRRRTFFSFSHLNYSPSMEASTSHACTTLSDLVI